MSSLDAFEPRSGIATVNLAVTTTSASVAITQGKGTTSLRLANVGANTIFVEFGTGTTAPTAVATTSMPILPNSVQVVSGAVTFVAAVAAALGNTLYATVGTGV